mmetsp:Transcript_51032/g.143442  ORF Transcript_51032/g.143442 Transcript_51032/m.143442 type:complete len:284 (-) Transcript_51032:1314-2165(-)
MPKSSIQQMQDSVLRSAHVQIDRHPVLIILLAESFFQVARIHESQVIPATSSPLRHGVRLSSKPLSVLLEVSPIFCASQASCGIIAWLEIFHVRQLQRKISFIHRNRLIISDRMLAIIIFGILRQGINAFWEVDREINGNRFSPISLSREYPVTKFVRDLGSSLLHFLEFLRDRHLALFCFHAIEIFATVHGNTRFSKRFFFVQLTLHRFYDPFNIQTKGLRKFKIPGIMRWNSHDSSGTITSQHVVSDPHGNTFARNRMQYVSSSKDTGLFLCGSTVQVRSR